MSYGHVMNNNDDLIICFNIGRRSKPYSNFCINGTENCYDTNDLLTLYKELEKYLLNDNYNNIYFIGHSAGFSNIVLFTFFLMTLTNNDIMQKYSKIYSSLIDLKFKEEICKKIHICGGGGFPLIFDDYDMFKFYYEFYGGRYLHICNSIKFTDKNMVVLDFFLHNMDNINNYKYYI